MTKTKAALLTAMKKSRVRSCKIGTTLYQIIGDDKGCKKEVKRLLNLGGVIIEGNTKMWINVSIVHDPTKEGSNQYTWKGDKVAHDRILVTIKDGIRTEEKLSRVWRVW